MRIALCLTVALGAVTLAPAVAAADAPAATLSASASPPRKHYVALQVDLGVPDLVGLSVVVRPLYWLHLQATGNTDLFSGGIGGGVTLVPLNRVVSPSVTIDGGHVFAAATHGIPRSIGIPLDGDRIGYDYFDAHAGLEIGANKRAYFFLHAGVSYMDISYTPPKDANMGFKEASLKIWGPSAKLGVGVYL
jgi:hypothetical protein